MLLMFTLYHAVKILFVVLCFGISSYFVIFKRDLKITLRASGWLVFMLAFCLMLAPLAINFLLSLRH